MVCAVFKVLVYPTVKSHLLSSILQLTDNQPVINLSTQISIKSGSKG
jgi:hypothetical protein